MSTASPTYRDRRAFGAVGAVLGGAGIFVFCLVAGLLLHLDLPAARREAARALNGVLAAEFKGKLVLEQVARVHVDEVGGIDVSMSAPDGTTVAIARGARARILPVAFVMSILRGKGPLAVAIFGIDVQSLEVNLDADAGGTLKLQTAFELLRPSNGTPSARPLELALEDVTVRRAFVHGRMKGFPPIDADLEMLRGALRVDGSRVTVDVSDVALVSRGMPQGANPRGAVAVHIVAPSATGRSFLLDGSFRGRVADIPATASATFDGSRLDAVADVPEVSDERVRAFLPQAPVHRPVAAHVEGHGDLARLHTTAHVTMGAAELEAAGDLSLTGKFAATMGVDLRKVDLRSLSLGAPPSSLALHADVRLDTRADGLIEGLVDTVVAGGHIGTVLVAPGAFHGDFRQRATADGGGVEVKIDGIVSEPGAPIHLRVGLRTGAPAAVVDFAASSRSLRLSDVPRLHRPGPGRAEARVAGTITLGKTPSFDATLAGDVEGVELANVRLEQGRVVVHAFGSFANPEVDAALEGGELRASRYVFHHATLTAAGPLSREQVTISLLGDGSPSVRASATMDVSATPTFENLDLDVSRGQKTLHAAVARIHFDAAGVDVAGATITGIGDALRGSLDTRRGSLTVRASSGGIDLATIGYLLGIEDRLRKGRLGFAVDLSARHDGADGAATADLEHGGIAGLDDVNGHVEARMDGRKVTAAIQTSIGDLGTLEARGTKLEVGGKGPLEAGSWRRTWGKLRVLGQIDLGKVAERLPPGTLPVSRLGGVLSWQANVDRDDEDDLTPNVNVTLKTSGLRLAPRSGPDRKLGGRIVVDIPPWESSGIDVQLDARADGDSGFAEIAARLVDKEGALVSLDAKSATVPFDRLLASSDGAARLLMDVPFSAVIEVPSRNVHGLPDLLKPAGARGDIAGRMSIEGTFRKPDVKAKATLHSVRFDRSPIIGGLDLEATATYDGSAGDVVVDGQASRKGVLHASGHVNAKEADVLGANGGNVPWDASAKATFSHFPLAQIAGLSDRQVQGQLSGRVEVTGLHKDARATVDLDVAKLRIGAEGFETGNVKAVLDGHWLDASMRLQRADAAADGNVKVSTTWGASLSPSIDPSGSSDASFQAKHFPAAMFAPFAEGILDELTGTVDGSAHASLHPNEKPKMDGRIALSDGVFELTAIGEELHGVKASAVFTPDGVVKLESLTASGTTGKLTASGVARLDGLKLAGAEASLRIDRSDAMPLAVQGASMGTVYGQFDMKAASSSDHKALSLKIDVPSLHVELPEASTHAVEELDESEPQTHIGVYASPGKFVLLPLDGLDALQQADGAPKAAITLTIDVHFGQNVEIRRGTDLRVELDGDLAAKIADPTEVSGQIRMKGGKIEVQGKSFEIESGTVRFFGDSSNPEVRVTASWTAPDGTRVYADYLGPLKTGKVILRSEPARPQNEILALILFGSADGLQPARPTGDPQPDSATKAGTVVGGFASAGLSKGLNKLTGLEITAKIDTRGANPRPEVAVQIARDISLQIAVVLGALPPGMNQDTTYATIDWRFFKDWSLETTFGNQGTSIADVVWQHRY